MIAIKSSNKETRMRKIVSGQGSDSRLNKLYVLKSTFKNLKKSESGKKR